MPAPAFVKKIPAGLLPGLIAGSVTGFTRLHPAWAPLQIPALALLAWSLAKAGGVSDRLRPGLWFGVAMAALVLANVGVPVPAAAILFVAMTGYWMVLGAGLSHLLQRGGIPGVLGAAGLLTLGEWAQSVAFPLFGTAQRLASSWVDYDAMRIPARFGGTLLITFLVATIAFGFAGLSRREQAGSLPKRWTRYGSVKAAIAGATLAALCIARFPTWETSLGATVAVCGSATKKSGAFLQPESFLKKYRPMIAEAAARGAVIVVTPEMALSVTPGDRDATLARLAGEARTLGVSWALGYAEGEPGDKPTFNRAVLLNAGAPVGSSYDKTHRVYFLESYARYGDAVAVTGSLKIGTENAKVGLMICQDDNYEDVSRNLSRAGVRLALVPTFDWPGVEHAHLQSARNRPRESASLRRAPPSAASPRSSTEPAGSSPRATTSRKATARWSRPSRCRPATRPFSPGTATRRC